MKKKISWKAIIGIILNLVIGANFLISAYAKIPSIEVFGWTIAESTPFNWTVAEWLARIVIGLEIFLGLLFVFQLFIKKLALPLASFLLVFFSVYLIYVLSVYGNEANCGCYGEMIPLSTKESLLKNGLILLLLFIARLFLFEIKFKFHKLVSLLFAIIGFGLPFYFSPPASAIIFSQKEIKNKNFPMRLISDSTNYVTSPKKIIAMVSPTCKYCKKAARRMSIIKKRNPEIPFQLVMMGHKDHLEAFLEETKSSNIPLIFMDSIEHFQKMNARNGVPTIKWLEDSTVVKRSTYFSLNESEILKWMKE